MLPLLCQPKTLWLLFIATLALTFGFQVSAPAAGGVLLDGISSTAEARELLASMSTGQKQAHIWITALLDIPYPFAYGGLFLGLCLRNGGRFALWLATPALLVIPIDLIENAVQIFTLLGNEEILSTKSILTPAKFLLFYAAAAIALGSLIANLVSTGIMKLRQ